MIMIIMAILVPLATLWAENRDEDRKTINRMADRDKCRQPVRRMRYATIGKRKAPGARQSSQGARKKYMISIQGRA